MSKLKEADVAIPEIMNKLPAEAHPLAEKPSEIASNIGYHARYSPHFSPMKFLPEQAYYATADSVRDLLIQRWNDTYFHFHNVDPKQTYYLSMEYLQGRALINAIGNLGVFDSYAEALRKLGNELEEVAEKVCGGSRFAVAATVGIDGTAGVGVLQERRGGVAGGGAGVRQHHKMAGAMNALVGGLCPSLRSNSKAIREAMCFLMDPQAGRKVCYNQFPQRFDGIDRRDRYANRNTVFFDINMKGLDGIQGPVYVGTGFS